MPVANKCNFDQRNSYPQYETPNPVLKVMFPFTVKYTTTLKPGFGQENYAEILAVIADYLSHKPVQKIVILADKLTFKGNGGRNDTVETFAKGVFELSERNYTVTLTYEFYMYRVFIIIGLLCFIGIVSQSYWFAIVGFIWVCGLNWCIGFFEHRTMFKEIAAGINDSFK